MNPAQPFQVISKVGDDIGIYRTDASLPIDVPDSPIADIMPSIDHIKKARVLWIGTSRSFGGGVYDNEKRLWDTLCVQIDMTDDDLFPND